MAPGEHESERERRIGVNESLFREVNEQVKDLADQFGIGDEPLDLVCECGDYECAARIRLSRAGYERVRSDSRSFAVLPGHEKIDVEEIVEALEGYSVVRKREGVPARVAESTDPRE